MTAFSSPPVRDPAAEVVDQLAQRHAHRQLVVAAVDNVAGEREDARARRVGRGADLRVLLRAELDDLRDGRDRLDVVDQARRGVEAGDGRERRLRARLAALALERLEQRRLLAADVRAGAAVEDDRDAAEQLRLVHLLERRLDHLELVQVLAADVDEDLVAADRVRRDQAALDQPVRDGEHDLAVLEGARLRLVRVDDEVGRLAGALREEARLAAGREEGAAAAAEARVEDLLDDLRRLHRARLRERLEAADGAVVRELRQQLAVLGARQDDEVLAQLPRSSSTIAGTSPAVSRSR